MPFKSEKTTNFGTLILACLILVIFSPGAMAIQSIDMAAKTRDHILTPWKGDLDGIIERRYLRVLTTYNKTNYFVDKATARGAAYEMLTRLEDYINKHYRPKGQSKHIKLHVLFIPTSRDMLLPKLLEGKGDMAAATLTITDERLKQVDFSDPIARNIKEYVVTGPGAPSLKSLDDLSGQEVAIRKSSSYFQSLEKLNQQLASKGKEPVKFKFVDENLETEDILEMTNAGILKITVADSYLASLWAKLFKDLKVHENLILRDGGEIGWAVRKDSPKLRGVLNKFIKSHKQGTLLGNIIIKRYYVDTKWVKDALNDADLKRFNNTVDYFQKYSSEYGFDWIMVTALAYQESGLDNSKVSPAGAVGIMQILPSTAAGKPIEIKDVKKLENNIHAGVKYLRYIYDRYYKDTDMDNINKVLMTFASYNAGPARITGLRNKAKNMGLDPDKWFDNVELVAAKVIGRETVQYVSNIFKYYLTYKYYVAKEDARQAKD